MADEPKDPYLSFNFYVEITGILVAGFHECSGLDSSIDVIKHREGGKEGGPRSIRRIPGQAKNSNIVLKKGMTSDLRLWQWHQNVREGKLERKSGSIILQDRAGEEVARWSFTDAWPAKWVGPNLTSEGNDVAIETMELAHEGLTRVK
jgi:phage tail-like protein